MLEERFFYNFRKMFPKLPLPDRQYKFHTIREWRFDFCWPDYKIAVEIQGGAFMRRGGHNTALGQAKDYDKLRQAVLLGWRLLPFNSMDLKKYRVQRRRGWKKLRPCDRICLMDCVKMTGNFLQREMVKELLK